VHSAYHFNNVDIISLGTCFGGIPAYQGELESHHKMVTCASRGSKLDRLTSERVSVTPSMVETPHYTTATMRRQNTTAEKCSVDQQWRCQDLVRGGARS